MTLGRIRKVVPVVRPRDFPASLPFGLGVRWHVVVATGDPNTSRRLGETLQALDVSYEIVSPERLAWDGITPTVFCISSAALDRLPGILRPAVVICGGNTITVPDRFLRVVAEGGVATVTLDELDPVSLLQALLIACERYGLLDLISYLPSRNRLGVLPLSLLHTFSLSPAKLNRLEHVCRALNVSKRAARRLVAEWGFRRAEHVFTLLRAETWIWFARLGVTRKVFEPYLGITNRWNFRRACGRAGIRPPWHESTSSSSHQGASRAVRSPFPSRSEATAGGGPDAV